ncbi:hypothetical protein TcarDRAFT_2517 [Thermosinus carboxydivorans Nor1]|uniref:Uncharacterized protein n=1 Tax=Thermosinus carboxydivorans Nor1 TaxID=401526 RepID=A1HLX5_9FIRM|nr:hypothetical protein [Thermosinus carboxydivorans]EAX48828.1 hypothetical protein TcarDRAFT_2517 [Thermosinus carboxydivorans Nor1]
MPIKRWLAMLLVLLLLCRPVQAFGWLDPAAVATIKEFLNAQTLDQLRQGVVAVPEEVVNEYLAGALANFPGITEARVTILPDNKLRLAFTARQTGRVVVEGRIMKFVQNQDESQMVVAVGKRSLRDRPVASWLFSHLSLGALVKLFGNPLTGAGDYFVARFDGNLLVVDFRPYIDQSPLRTVTFAGRSLVDLIAVDAVTTGSGVLYLHVSYHGPGELLALLRQFLD